MREAQLAAIETRPLFDDPGKLIDYLSVDLAHARSERLRALYVDNRVMLLADELVTEGSADDVAFSSRAVLHRALDLGATGLFLVHNHPSGDPSPTHGDVAVTRQLKAGADALGLRLHDHLIISRTGWTSLRRERLL